MYETPELNVVIFDSEEILTESYEPGGDIWDDGKGDNATEDDEL